MRAPTPLLRLAPHVRACRIDREVILLDLVRGKYYGLPCLDGFEQHVQGWPPGDPLEPVVHADARDRLIGRLRRANLLAGNNGEATSRDDAPVPVPRRALDAVVHARPRPSLLFLARFAEASASAALAIQFRSLPSIVALVQSRRAIASRRGVHADLDLCAHAAAFEHLRPILFTVRDRCLFDSLALHQFLTYFGFQPRLVIGVKTCPFGAHAWLQWGDLVLNDHVEHVMQFRPILPI